MAGRRREELALRKIDSVAPLASYDFLEESEEKLLENEEAFERARAVRALGQLAPYVTHLEKLVEDVRTTRHAHVLGRLTVQTEALVFTLQEWGVGPFEATSPTIVSLVAEAALDEELESQKQPIIKEPAAEPPVLEIVEGEKARELVVERPEILNEKGITWLKGTLGENWRTRLNVDENENSPGTIAAALLQQVPGADTPQKRRRVELYLTGLSWNTIAETLGESAAAGQVFLSNLRGKLRQQISVERPVRATQTQTPKKETTSSEPTDALGEKERPNQGQQLSFEERHELVLVTSIQRPSVVTPSEWLKEAEAHLNDLVAKRSLLTTEETSALWSRLHFDAEGKYKSELSFSARDALNKLQRRLVEHREIFANSKEKEVAIKMLLNTALGVKNLNDIHLALKRIDASLTENVAQRYVTSAVMELIDAD